MLADVRAVIANLRRRPFGVVAAAASLALGVALNVTVVQGLRDAYWAPLPYANADRLVSISFRDEDTVGVFLTDSHLQVVREVPGIAGGVATIECWPGSLRAWADVQWPTGAERMAAAYVTPNLFDVLGVRAFLGRTFAVADLTATVPVAVVSHRLFAERFDSRPEALGRSLRVGGVTYAVIGVLPDGFSAPLPDTVQDPAHRNINVWILQDPQQVAGRPGRAFKYLTIALLRQGATSQALATASQAVNRAMIAAGVPKGGWVVRDLRSEMSHSDLSRLGVLLGLSFLLLAISIANVVTVYLTRSLGHARQMAIRAALGACGWHLWRVPVLEAAALSAIGTFFGCFGASWGYAFLARVFPLVARAGTTGIAASTVVISLLIVTCASTCALVALAAGRVPSHFRELLGSSTVSGRSPRLEGWHTGLVQAQMAIMVALVAPTVGLWAALSSVHGSQALSRRTDVIVADARLVPRRGTEPEVLRRIQDGLVARTRAIAGVRNVGAGSEIPIQDVSEPNYVVSLPGRGKRVLAHGSHVDSDYFAVLRPGLLAGRVFDHRDRPDGLPVAVVSVSFAQKAFGRTNVVGERINWHGVKTIVGVVTDQGFGQTVDGPRPAVYISRHQEPWMRFCMFVEVADVHLVSSIVQQLTHLDPEQPLDSVLPLPVVIEDAFRKQSAYARGAAVLALLGLALGVAGVFAATTWSMAGRVREIGIRLALGASIGRLVSYFVMRYLARLRWAGLIAIPATVWLCWRVERAAAPLRLPVAWALFGTVVALMVVCALTVVATAWSRASMGPAEHRAALE